MLSHFKIIFDLFWVFYQKEIFDEMG